MDGVVAALILSVGGLVAWRWWLDSRREQRAHELELRKQVVAVEQKTLDGLAGRMTSLEEQMKTLAWKRA